MTDLSRAVRLRSRTVAQQAVQSHYALSSIPLDLGYLTHRFGEWVMLMVGEGILSMVAAQYHGRYLFATCLLPVPRTRILVLECC